MFPELDIVIGRLLSHNFVDAILLETKNMKIFLTATTYLGLALIALSVMIGVQIIVSGFLVNVRLFSSSDYIGLNLVETVISGSGVLLALLGSFLMKTRSLWKIFIVLSSCYFVSLIGLFILASFYLMSFKPNTSQYAFCLLPLIPGVACVCGGLSLRKIKATGETAISLYTVLGFLGLTMMAGGTYLTITYYVNEIRFVMNPNNMYRMYQMVPYSWVPVGWLIGYGSLFTLTGSLIGRVRKVWIPMVVIGAFSVLSFLPEFYLWYRPLPSLAPGFANGELGSLVRWQPSVWDIVSQMKFMLPGFGSIIGGFILRGFKLNEKIIIEKST